MASTGTALALIHPDREFTRMGMSTMFTTFTTPGLTLLFLGVVVSLGAAFVWMFWEIEQASKPQLVKREKARGHHRAPS
ncbi:hypothetical protein [Bradyrhizobium sp. dw_411]|uniref:hypothetical protein n=1 Tax=Bradyrhizobium sp. dw_411 TaxID=2720082 RepID=UPI001BCD0C53|nr:hypothetical protein [Bradyrhizobium sp. dw_411]